MKKVSSYTIIFWALFIGFSLGGFTMVMLAAVMNAGI